MSRISCWSNVPIISGSTFRKAALFNTTPSWKDNSNDSSSLLPLSHMLPVCPLNAEWCNLQLLFRRTNKKTLFSTRLPALWEQSRERSIWVDYLFYATKSKENNELCSLKDMNNSLNRFMFKELVWTWNAARCNTSTLLLSWIFNRSDSGKTSEASFRFSQGSTSFLQTWLCKNGWFSVSRKVFKKNFLTWTSFSKLEETVRELKCQLSSDYTCLLMIIWCTHILEYISTVER